MEARWRVSITIYTSFATSQRICNAFKIKSKQKQKPKPSLCPNPSKEPGKIRRWVSPGSHLGEASSLAQGGVGVMQDGAATQTQCKVVTETQGLDQYPPVELQGKPIWDLWFSVTW